MSIGSATRAGAHTLDFESVNTFNRASSVAGGSQPHWRAWWSYTAVQPGILRLDTETTTTSGSYPDTMLFVYTGASDPGTLVVSDDDSGTGPLSSLHFLVTPGETYYIAVGTFDSDGDQVTQYHLNATFDPGHWEDHIYDWNMADLVAAIGPPNPGIIFSGGAGDISNLSDNDPTSTVTFPHGTRLEDFPTRDDYRSVIAGLTTDQYQARIELDLTGTPGDTFDWGISFYTDVGSIFEATQVGSYELPGWPTDQSLIPASGRVTLSTVLVPTPDYIYDDSNGHWSVANMVNAAVVYGSHGFWHLMGRLAFSNTNSAPIVVSRYQLILSKWIPEPLLADSTYPCDERVIEPLALTNFFGLPNGQYGDGVIYATEVSLHRIVSTTSSAGEHLGPGSGDGRSNLVDPGDGAPGPLDDDTDATYQELWMTQDAPRHALTWSDLGMLFSTTFNPTGYHPDLLTCHLRFLLNDDGAAGTSAVWVQMRPTDFADSTSVQWRLNLGAAQRGVTQTFDIRNDAVDHPEWELSATDAAGDDTADPWPDILRLAAAGNLTVTLYQSPVTITPTVDRMFANGSLRVFEFYFPEVAPE